MPSRWPRKARSDLSPTDAPEIPTRVGIGLIGRDGRYLARVRPEGGPMPGVWEFPGGKCEPGETPAQATARECFEEVGLAVAVGRLDRITRFRYPHGLVELHYFHCTPEPTDAEPSIGSGFRWVAARDLPMLQFPPANEELIADLAQNTTGPTGPGGPAGPG